MMVHWLGFDMVVGSNHGRHELSFLFAKIIFGMDEKGQKHGRTLKVLLEQEIHVRGVVLRVYFICIVAGLNGMHVNLEFYQIYNKLFVFLEFSKNCLAALKTRQATHALGATVFLVCAIFVKLHFSIL